MKRKTKIYISAILSAIVLTFFLFTQFSKAQNGTLRVYFFDVGQGDSALIRTPEGRDILVDGGPGKAVLERLDEVLPFWDRYIDVVVLTHPHEDHIGGLDDVLERYTVGRVLEPDILNEPENMVYFNKLAGLTEVGPPGVPGGTTSVSPIVGDKIILEQDLEMGFVYPLSLHLEEDDLNDTSLVFQLKYKGKKFLFVGDATSEVEAKIMSADLDADFLKVGHHGSRYSSSMEFLEKVTPIISFISVGEGNSFGHPTKDALDRLKAVGSRVLRTDKSGTVEVEIFDTGEWRIRCEEGCGG